MIYGYRKEFGERLKKLMPPHLTTAATDERIVDRIKIDNMRIAANSFAHALQGDVPRSEEEVRDVLYVFGKVTHDMLQKQIDQLQDLDHLRMVTVSAPITYKTGEF